MTGGRMQAKDIPDAVMLADVARVGRELGYGRATVFHLREALPPELPEKLLRAKLRKLTRRGLLRGCYCGCRGDFELTYYGRAFLLTALALEEGSG